MRLSWPIMTSNMAVVLYQVANTFWLGNVGSGAVAAVAIAFPLLGFLWAIGDGMVMGGSALVARYSGSGDNRSVNRVAAHVAAGVFAYYVLVALVVLPFLRDLVLLLGAPQEIVGDTYSFIRILVLAMPLTEIFFVYSSMLQGTGNSLTPMKMWSLALMLNMVLDPILIVGVGGIGGYGLTGSAA
ncbi:MAG: MATE family efflux transporter, partial [Bacillota bacterium]